VETIGPVTVCLHRERTRPEYLNSSGKKERSRGATPEQEKLKAKKLSEKAHWFEDYKDLFALQAIIQQPVGFGIRVAS
jgi:hypothetical protein